MEKTIYVVEDDLDISELIGIILNNAGFQVRAAATVEGFYQLLETKIPDLILLDIMLPDGNGVEVCKELKQEGTFKNVPVILMSAHAKFSAIAGECAADDFIAKPFDIYDLTNKVKVQLAS
jgi:DNA-binding response OmpR family regulator